MRILITGSTGLLGQALFERLASAHEVWGLSRRAAASGRHLACDLTDRAQVAAQVIPIQPELIIHAAAQADVDQSERDRQGALAGNVWSTQHLVTAARQVSACVLYISTDYVFDGLKGSPYVETDAPNPVSYYGQTKLEAERVVQASGLRWCIVRPSTLFGPGRPTFMDKVIERAEAGQPVPVFVDQTTSPTYAPDAAEGIARLLEANAEGIVHLANRGAARRDVVAREALKLWGMPAAPLREMRLAEARLPARRPPNSSLAIGRLQAMTGWSPPSWQQALHAYLTQKKRSISCTNAS